MDDGRTYYEILQVSTDASVEVIHSAYRTLMTRMRKHPDLGGDVREAALINVAYETLSDADARRAYDARLAAGRAPTPAAKGAERRRAPRRAVDATASFCLDHESTWYPARICDCSVLGVRLRSRAALVSGQHIVIAPPNTQATAFHGTVRWTRMFHPSLFERVYEAGVEFADRIDDIDERLNV